ncbi:glutaminyl-peptide cyclotransferase [Sphingopyxis sp. RIFCSPHIGHO2_12_FULL_65_19]|uniref:glutaminyl-peptide cyclotransferase n=1 Tax=Sphingopyxis sp. RIFCSPHIGHO2_12_FULL_65_19 TaxID=1802172 RepID=UPI0008C388E5|nr:glutaminyl-peptide cyclotransferase [Sphingopyxis sp. RIFCSPHIGHO2_12_FULL_65_19]OHD09383.1 MAG: glutamine cyclotransferase [Sphingopyxis sp. RIFCSPHIGHO2_12_FULL_65_19]
MTIFLLTLAMLADPTVKPPPIERCGYRIVETFPHDATSFTQGLFWDEGHLYEATGQYGRSRVARLDLKTGKALAETKLPQDQFGEGITRWGDQIVGVTWRGGIGNRWSIKDLKPVGTFRYQGEGWGVTMVDGSLALSDGTSMLRFLDPATMTEQRRVTVRFGGRPITMINELETIDGQVWANVWMTDFIVRIDPATGEVAALVDLSGLRADAGASGTDSVLNGIAWDAKNRRLFVTGKNWPKLYEITLADCR